VPEEEPLQGEELQQGGGLLGELQGLGLSRVHQGEGLLGLLWGTLKED
jgi:hypothetical protein